MKQAFEISVGEHQLLIYKHLLPLGVYISGVGFNIEIC